MKAIQVTRSFFYQVSAVRMCVGLCLLVYTLTLHLIKSEQRVSVTLGNSIYTRVV